MKLYNLYIINNGWQPETNLSIEFIEDGVFRHDSGSAETMVDKYGDCEVQFFIKKQVGILI